MNELAWDWEKIAIVLFWRLAPNGVVITPADLAGLPMDRVLLEQRTSYQIQFTWVSVAHAEGLRERIPRDTGQKVGVTELQGRWMKTATVLLWKLGRDGITLTPRDLDAVPDDKSLLSHGHADGIEFRFLPHKEADRILKWERDNEGKMIIERL